MDWLVPVTITDVRSFLGLFSFFWKFILWFNEIAAPLTDLTKKNKPWLGDDQDEKAFNVKKKAMITTLVLQLSNFDSKSIVTTDAS